jgi:hypothetical protein
MIGSQRSLTAVQLSRNTLAEVAEAKAPLREAALESFRRRNAVLDAIFYDIGKISIEEARAISPWLAKEGAILIVPPTGQGAVQLCADTEDFFARGGSGIRILTVAGVGSSALGSAAFARNVADACGQPAAAVVSGYGLADLITEAAGGWFWFGGLNRLRHQFEELDALTRGSWSDSPVLHLPEFRVPLERISLDTRTVCELLADRRADFSLLTGHSKGNLVISEALYELEELQGIRAAAVAADIWVVTVSAAIAIPVRFRNVVDVIGDIDWFGALNSTPGVDVEKKCHLSWHHTNTELWFHLPVTQVFSELLRARRIVLDTRREPVRA